MPTVYHNEVDILEVGTDWVDRLKQEASVAPRQRARLCLHRSSEDGVQEMLIVFCKDATIPPHRCVNGSESIHVIEGESRVVVFDDQGAVERTYDMGPLGSGKPFMARNSSSPWYTYVPLSEFLVVHEILQGPFDKSNTEFPGWTPEESELASFLQRAAGL